MRQTVNVEQKIIGEAEAIWKTISKGEDVHKWFPTVIQSCRLKRANGKLFRSCTMYDGSLLQETIVEIDDKARKFVYTVDEHPLPASKIMTTIKVKYVENKLTSITWSAEFTVEEENIPLVEETLREIYTQGIQSLENWHQKNLK